MKRATLKDILDDMIDLQASDDIEIKHLEGDALLIHTLRLLVSDSEDSELVDQIISAWSDLSKWYA